MEVCKIVANLLQGLKSKPSLYCCNGSIKLSGCLFIGILIAGCKTLPSLHDAISDGRTKAALALIETSDIHEKDSSGNAPLHYAATHGNSELVEALIEKGAKVDVRNIKNKTPLMYASQSCNTEVSRVLMQYGADVNAKAKLLLTPIHFAAGNNCVEAFQLLLEQGANLQQKSRDRYTVMHFAANKNSIEIVKILLEKGADFDNADDLGRTPYDAAILNESFEVADCLLAVGVEPARIEQSVRNRVHRRTDRIDLTAVYTARAYERAAVYNEDIGNKEKAIRYYNIAIDNLNESVQMFEKMSDDLGSETAMQALDEFLKASIAAAAGGSTIGGGGWVRTMKMKSEAASLVVKNKDKVKAINDRIQNLKEKEGGVVLSPRALSECATR